MIQNGLTFPLTIVLYIVQIIGFEFMQRQMLLFNIAKNVTEHIILKRMNKN